MRISIYNVQEEPIGCGGMGNVYLGFDAHGNKVAIKEMRAELVPDASLRMRFQEEIRLMSKFEHPFIVKMYASFVENGNMYLVMEHIDGITLEKHVRLKGRLTEAEAVSILTKVLDALQYAHNKGVVHRDIKPSNIMIREDGRICLLDFGIAKDLNGKGLTVGELSIGTSGYMSPEQAEGLTINHLSDIYSLGCVLYYMLTGQHAVVKQNNDHATRMTIILNDFPKANMVNPNISDFIMSILDGATNKNMRKRFQSCREFELKLSRISGTVPCIDRGVDVISIGRGDCDIKIYDPHNKVSSHHADIEVEYITGGGNRYIYIDRSTNGTLINGEVVHNQRKECFRPMRETVACPNILLACSPSYPLDWMEVERAFKRKREKAEGRGIVPKYDPDPHAGREVDSTEDSLPMKWKLLSLVSIVASSLYSYYFSTVIGILISFIFPVVSWVVYFRCREKSPAKAKDIAFFAWLTLGAAFIVNFIYLSL